MTDVAIVDLAESCKGVCTAHSSPIPMVGKIVGQGISITAYDSELALDQYTVLGDCNHTGILSAGSTKVTVHGKKVAMVGDSFSGDFSGTVVHGQPKFQLV